MLLEIESRGVTGTRRGWGSRQKAKGVGTSLEVQWLGLQAPTAGDTGLIPRQGSKNPQASRCGKKNKTKQAEYVLAQSGSQNPRFLGFLCSSQNEQEGMLFLRVQSRPGREKTLLKGEV